MYFKTRSIWLASILSVGVSMSLATAKVEAHFLATDGTVGAVLHVDPDDDPIAGQSANLYFEITDSSKKFQLANCNCQLQVLESGKILQNGPLSRATMEGLMAKFIFPTRDVYTVTLNGAPKDVKSFTPFTLRWNIRVDRQTSSTSNSKPYFVYGLTFVVVVLGIYLTASKRSNQDIDHNSQNNRKQD